MTAFHPSFTAGARHAPLPATGRLFFALLERMDYGGLMLTTPDGVTRRFGPGAAPGANAAVPAEADLTIRDWKLCRDVVTGGDVAFAEAYMDGRWDTNDLDALLTVIAFNERALQLAFYGQWWRQLAFRLKHLLRSNSRRRARKNIVAHYDLGNDFYQLWLDPTMSYSSALFDGDHAALAVRRAAGEVRCGSSSNCACRPAPTCWRSVAAGAASPKSPHGQGTA